MQDDNNNYQPPASNNQVVYNAPKKSRKTLYVILGSVLFVLAIAGVVLFLLLNNKKDDATDDDRPTPMAYIESFQSASHEGEGVRELVSESNNTSNDVMYKLQDGSWIAADSTASVATINLESEDADVNRANYNNIVDRLTSGGFVETESLDYSSTDYDPSVVYAQYFSSETMVCNVRNIPSSAVAPLSPVYMYVTELSCASADDFSENKAAFAPFAEAYATSDAKMSQDVLLSDIEIQDSAIEDYKNAKLNMTAVSTEGISEGMYYQTPDGSWNFFAATKDRDNISCSDYSNDDMLKAFTGFVCFDDAKDESSFVHMQDPEPEPTPEDEASGSGG
jgi:hypothetical protein